jgi:four helix bundle protein
MFRFEKLEIWKESLNYGKEIYLITSTFPKAEAFGLTSQIQRAALSISSNIAEGSGSSSKKDFAHFLDIAIKSTAETASQLLFAENLDYIEEKNVQLLYDKAEVLIKRIQAFKKALKIYEK